jgi:hypothetical protein
MTILAGAEAVLGGALLFFLPGYALTKALYPEWRVRGPAGIRRLVEVVTLSFVVSIGLTVVVGYGLLNLAPGGFSAAWSDPLLEAVLAGIFVLALAVALVRGAFRAVPPAGPPASVASESGEEGAWEVSRELERLGRDERRVQHALRRAPRDSAEAARLEQELTSIRTEKDAVRTSREEQYGS